MEDINWEDIQEQLSDIQSRLTNARDEWEAQRGIKGTISYAGETFRIWQNEEYLQYYIKDDDKYHYVGMVWFNGKWRCSTRADKSIGEDVDRYTYLNVEDAHDACLNRVLEYKEGILSWWRLRAGAREEITDFVGTLDTC